MAAPDRPPDWGRFFAVLTSRIRCCKGWRKGPVWKRPPT